MTQNSHIAILKQMTNRFMEHQIISVIFTITMSLFVVENIAEWKLKMV